jgi:hypothetical protein
VALVHESPVDPTLELRDFSHYRKPSRSARPPIAPSRIYDEAQDEDWARLPHCRPLDHTMFDALDEYVAQKLPTAALYQALIDGVPIEVHGIYPGHLPAVARRLGIIELIPVPFTPQRADKRLNFVRPSYFRGKRGARPLLIVAVTPGREYLLHYAGLIRHFLYLHTSRAQEHVRIIRYPGAERALTDWTNLSRFVRPTDTVLVGYVDEIASILAEDGFAQGDGGIENPYYVSRRYRRPSGRDINLIGVKFSFWAGIAGRLATAFCHAGASEILYCGKLGSLESPDDVYERIFCPSRYFLMEHHRLVEEIDPPPNPFLARFPSLDSAAHVTVPTVIEEDYLQRNAAAAIAAASIDNEIAHMAAAIAQHNRAAGRETGFSAVHFATDYVRKFDERNLNVTLNLSNNRTHVALEKKRAVIRRICREFLGPYLRG